MNTVCSSAGIIYADYPRQGVADVVNSGFQEVWVDFAMYCPPDVFEKYGKKYIQYKLGERVIQNPENMRNAMAPLLDACKTNDLEFGVGIAPFLGQESEREDLVDLLVKIVERSITICGEIGCRYLVVHPLFFGETETEIWKKIFSYYMSLVPIAKSCGVTILLQNQVKNLNGHLVRGLWSDGVTAAEWVDALNHEASIRYGEGEYFGFCIHTGNCNLCGQNMYDFVVSLGSRIKAVILTDNNGHNGASLLPYSAAQRGTSQTDWLNLIRGLRKIGFDGNLIIEFCDTALAFSPILRPQLMKLAKATADYFKWQIELENLLKKYPSRVLFGAGNMCRNYMKCYGEQYPPLYTCDNNPTKWGTQFCGLTIQSPDKLKELPDDTVIFICNIYYREIEQQLREMGLRNPIEFFNDEYLPSFHFDRVEDIIERKESGGVQT